MKIVTKIRPFDDIVTLIKTRFLEFNRKSSPSKGRKYPADLRELISKGAAAGISQSELRRLSGMSKTAIANAMQGAIKKPLTVRRLEIVGSTAGCPVKLSPLVVRLPSGITIELSDAQMLTATLVSTLANLEVNHATSR